MMFGLGGIFVALIALILVVLFVVAIGAAVYYYRRDRD